MSKRKPIYFTSDWHLGHANVINFSKRPFTDLDNMHAALISNFNKIVTPDSVTYFLGDIVFLGSEKSKELIDQLNGTKILVLGNHDKGVESSYNSGFDVVLNSATIFIEQEKVTLSHYPLVGLYRENTEKMKNRTEGEGWHGEFRHTAAGFTVKNEGQFHLHGHIHSPNSGQSTRTLGRQFDVGVDANNYRPVHIGEIASWISKTKYLEKQVDKNE